MISYTQISTFNLCRRKWKYRYIDNLRDYTPDSADLLFGTAMHEVYEAYWRGERDYFTLVERAKDKLPSTLWMVAEVMVAGYLESYSELDRETKLISAEDESKVTVDGVDLIARFGAVMECPVRGTVMVEHKTTRSADISPTGMWYARKQTDLQTRMYCYVAGKMGVKIDYVCFDVVRRPLYRKKRTETTEQFKDRVWGLVSKSVEACDDTFYTRHYMKYSEEELESTGKELAQTVCLLNHCRKAGIADKNGQSCSAFGRECEYYHLCWNNGDGNG